MRHEPVFAKGDGNCLFNSVSILMTGKEEDAPIFRLGAALYGAVHFEHILEQVSGNYWNYETYVITNSCSINKDL